MPEFVTKTGCTVAVHYVSQMSMWDAPGVWLILRMIGPVGRLDGRAASLVLTQAEAQTLISALELGTAGDEGVVLATGVSFRVVEVLPEELGPLPGIWLALTKPGMSGEVTVVMTPDEVDTLMVALRYALEDAAGDEWAVELAREGTGA